MPFTRPTLAELQSQAEADLAGRLGLPALLRRSILAALARMDAGLVHLLHGHQEWIARQAMPDTADGDELARWASLWGVARLAPVASTGRVRFLGTDGFNVPAGTALRRVDGVAFTTDELGVVAGGILDVDVTASEPGAAGDTASGAGVLQLATSLAGVESGVTVITPGLSGGADLETDEALRARLLTRLRAGARGGSAADYEAWALEVPTVSRAWALPLHLGAGTVGVTFLVSSGGTAPIPEPAEVAEVQDHIDALRPVTAAVTVFAPGTQAVDVEVVLTPNTAQVQGAVEAALQELFEREAEPGGTVYVSRINEAISTAAGETDHVLNLPAANIVLPAGTVAVLGDVDFV